MASMSAGIIYKDDLRQGDGISLHVVVAQVVVMSSIVKAYLGGSHKNFSSIQRRMLNNTFKECFETGQSSGGR